jgi:penicillin-binding protein 1A
MLASLPKFRRPATVEQPVAGGRAPQQLCAAANVENNFITAAQFKFAAAEPAVVRARTADRSRSTLSAEMARRDALERLGNEALTDGYTIRTTLDSRAQDAANQALRDDLIAYDQRHGYRGPEAHVELSAQPAPAELDKQLDAYRPVVGLIPGIVTESTEKSALVYLQDGQSVPLELAAVTWAHAYQDESHRGPAVKRVDALLKPGDVVRMARAPDGKWKLSQCQTARGTASAQSRGWRDQAEIGGFGHAHSKFNARSVQPSARIELQTAISTRQRSGTDSRASIVNDAPIVTRSVKPNGLWTPQNDDGKIRRTDAPARGNGTIEKPRVDAPARRDRRAAREYVTRFEYHRPDPDNMSMAPAPHGVADHHGARVRRFITVAFVDPLLHRLDQRPRRQSLQGAPSRCRRPDRLIEDARTRPPGQAEKAQGDGVKATALSPIARAGGTAPAGAADPNKPTSRRVLDARIAY